MMWLVALGLVMLVVLAIVFVAALCIAASRGDRMVAEACRGDVGERQERAAVSDLRTQRTVIALPQRKPADVIEFPTDRGAA